MPDTRTEHTDARTRTCESVRTCDQKYDTFVKRLLGLILTQGIYIGYMIQSLTDKFLSIILLPSYSEFVYY